MALPDIIPFKHQLILTFLMHFCVNLTKYNNQFSILHLLSHIKDSNYILDYMV